MLLNPKHRNSLTIKSYGVIIFLVLFYGLLGSCKSGNKSMKTGMNETEQYQILASQHLGEKYVVEFNESGKLVLCKSGFLPDPSVAHYHVKFFVFDKDKQEIIYQDVIPRGEVVWFNNNTLKVSTIPGIVMPDEEVISNTYLYDLVKKQRTTLGSTEKF